MFPSMRFYLQSSRCLPWSWPSSGPSSCPPCGSGAGRRVPSLYQTPIWRSLCFVLPWKPGCREISWFLLDCQLYLCVLRFLYQKGALELQVSVCLSNNAHYTLKLSTGKNFLSCQKPLFVFFWNLVLGYFRRLSKSKHKNGACKFGKTVEVWIKNISS